MGELVVDPPQAVFVADQESQASLNLFNVSTERLAVKVRCSDNDQYRLRPVYAFVEPGTVVPLTIARRPAPPKPDKLVIQYVVAAPDQPDPADLFRTPFTFASVQVPLVAVDAAPSPAEPPRMGIDSCYVP